MPFITPKKTATAAQAFVWDAFPPPPPEAETWQPDPDSIARPGGLPDLRFNRDPEQDRRSKSFRKEAKMYGTPQRNGQTPSSPPMSGNSLGRGLGHWPAPAPRSTGYPRDFMHDANSASPPLELVAVLETPYKQFTTTVKSVARASGLPKGTMELMSAPKYRRPETPVTSRASTKSVSPSKSLPPAWAASLEKALAEDDRKLDALAATTTTSKVLSRPETVRKKSIPPHLRSKIGDEGKVRPPVSSTQIPGLNLNPNAKVYEALVKREDSIKDEALAWEMATAEPGIEHANHGLRMQQEILNRYIAKQPTTTTIPVAVPTACAPLDHTIKVRVMLIRAMEHELDLDRVAPERGLMAMQRAELDRYYDKVCSAHQQWWEAMGKA